MQTQGVADGVDGAEDLPKTEDDDGDTVRAREGREEREERTGEKRSAVCSSKERAR